MANPFPNLSHALQIWRSSHMVEWVLLPVLSFCKKLLYFPLIISAARLDLFVLRNQAILHNMTLLKSLNFLNPCPLYFFSWQIEFQLMWVKYLPFLSYFPHQKCLVILSISLHILCGIMKVTIHVLCLILIELKLLYLSKIKILTSMQLIYFEFFQSWNEKTHIFFLLINNGFPRHLIS